MSRFDFSNDTTLPVQIVWSTKYAMPIFIVNDGSMGSIKQYAPMSGEYGGYYEDVTEVIDLVKTSLGSPTKLGESATFEPPKEAP